MKSYIIGSAVVSLFAIIALRTVWIGTGKVERDLCGEGGDTPIDVGSEHFRRLAAAIQIRTISRGADNYNKSALVELNEFLRREYSNVFSSLFITSEVISNYSLLLKVDGEDVSLEPYLLMSHMDVVPAVSPEWTVDPFAGHIDDEFIWGRGAIDVKNTLLGIMEVLELVAKSGQRPRRPFYVAFGHDEEVGGTHGAVRIAALLQQRGVRFNFILDEGMAVTEDVLVPGLTALVGVTEKGLLTLKMSINMTGGHSSAPRAESALSVLSRAVTKLSQTPHPHYFSHGVEVDMLEQLAPSFPLPMRVVVSNIWLFFPLVGWIMADSSETAAIIRTTTAVTIFRSGIKANVIPGYAEAIVNHRVHPLETFEDVIRRDQEIVGDDRVKIEEAGDDMPNSTPPPVSSWRTYGFSVISKAAKQVFNNLPVAPALCIGNTDARHYSALSDNVYRFTPTIFKPGDTKRFHGPNERISKDNYARTINFFHHIIRNADGSGDKVTETVPEHDL